MYKNNGKIVRLFFSFFIRKYIKCEIMAKMLQFPLHTTALISIVSFETILSSYFFVNDYTIRQSYVSGTVKIKY